MHVLLLQGESVFISILHNRNEVYPHNPSFLVALTTYAEHPFYPVPLGVMSYFVALFPIILGAIVSMIVNRCFRRVIKAVDLYPKIAKPPNMMLIWMQQSRREADLARLDRTAWTWLAKRYMMFPRDPLLNIRFIFDTAWEDFRKPRYDIWPTIKTILRVNALYHKVHRQNLLQTENDDERSLSETTLLQRRRHVLEFKQLLHGITAKENREKLERGEVEQEPMPSSLLDDIDFHPHESRNEEDEEKLLGEGMMDIDHLLPMGTDQEPNDEWADQDHEGILFFAIMLKFH